MIKKLNDWIDLNGIMVENNQKSAVFWIYILECENRNYYTGYTKDLVKRYQQHLKGKVKYTRSFKPIRIAQCWQVFDEVGMALKIERFIKKQDRRTKEILIKQPKKLNSLLFKKSDFKPKIYHINPMEITVSELLLKKR